MRLTCVTQLTKQTVLLIVDAQQIDRHLTIQYKYNYCTVEQALQLQNYNMKLTVVFLIVLIVVAALIQESVSFTLNLIDYS